MSGGAGGGAIRFNIENTLTVNGSLYARGAAGSCTGSVYCSGAGSGGSIYVNAAILSGSGSILASGGNGASAIDTGGNGGGGRMALYIVTNNWSGNALTASGAAPAGTGGNGGSNGTVVTGSRPTDPTSLAQYRSDGTTVISTGATTTETTVVLKATMSDGDSSDTLTPEVEVRALGTAFSDTANYTGSSVSFTGTPITGSVTATSLGGATSYHWQLRVCDATSQCSAWVSYGGNSESSSDFAVDTAPNAPTSLGPSSLIDGSSTDDDTPTFTFTLSDPNSSDQVRFRIQIDNTSDFSSPVIDYTSDLSAQGSFSFTAGQSGTQELANDAYYWRVKAIDEHGAESSYSTANSGNVAFTVNKTSSGGGSSTTENPPPSTTTPPTTTTTTTTQPPQESAPPTEPATSPTQPPSEPEKGKGEEGKKTTKSTPQQIIETLISNETVQKVGKLVEDAAKSAAAPAINTVALVATSVLPIIPITASIFPYLSIGNLPSLLIGLIRKKKQPWGIIYDSETKLPLDPVVITLKDNKGNTWQAVSDIYGRYEFLADEGEYELIANKTNYSFPSKMYTAPPVDEVYDDVFLGGNIALTKGTKIAHNVPMDATGEDWNEREKARMGYNRLNKLFYKISAFFFYFGFVTSIVSAVFNPGILQLLIVAGFIMVTIYRTYRVIRHPWGTIKGKQTDKPVPNAIVRLINVEIPKLKLPPIVTKEDGRYDFLVEKGKYQIAIEIKDKISGMVKEVYKSSTIEIVKEFGSIGKDIKI